MVESLRGVSPPHYGWGLESRGSIPPCGLYPLLRKNELLVKNGVFWYILTGIIKHICCERSKRSERSSKNAVFNFFIF